MLKEINGKMKVPFDREYATSYKSEVKWLHEHGIDYVFVKVINTITTYKYKKNSRLYQSLADFYEYLKKMDIKVNYTIKIRRIRFWITTICL